jgi:hypothetical protein
VSIQLNDIVERIFVKIHGGINSMAFLSLRPRNNNLCMVNSVGLLLKRILSDCKNFGLFVRIYLSADSHEARGEFRSMNRIRAQC